MGRGGRAIKRKVSFPFFSSPSHQRVKAPDLCACFRKRMPRFANVGLRIFTVSDARAADRFVLIQVQRRL